ncbi:YgaP family membrane protein [Pseudolabrys sp.]|uniref:YgaP family membrane protein n=1 Tax=Pseudolabrys sp. TaxID=1960880 RepID=UPI003D0BD736
MGRGDGQGRRRRSWPGRRRRQTRQRFAGQITGEHRDTQCRNHRPHRTDRHRTGLIAFALDLIASGTGWNWVGWIGVVPILTAFIGTCPAYSLFGWSTR